MRAFLAKMMELGSILTAIWLIMQTYLFHAAKHDDGYAYYLAFFLVARYYRLFVNIVAFYRFGPYLPAIDPRYKPSDVTVIVPTTFRNPDHLIDAIRRALACLPAALFVVTENGHVAGVREHCNRANLFNVQIIGVPRLNKRVQMLRAIREVQTSITVFIDDDVFMPARAFLRHLLAPFEDALVGATGPRQRVRRNATVNIWNILGIGYLERRNFNTGATNFIDGGVSTLSGRCQAIRTDILKTDEFANFFQNDTFLGKPLMVDDDKAVTRYLYQHNYKIALNFSDDCTIETVQEDSWAYIDQCIRWARGHWRGNIIVMSKEYYWTRVHTWTLAATYIAQFQTPALIVDGIGAVLLYLTVRDYDLCAPDYAYIAFGLWVMFTKLVKMIPHFMRHPQDMIFIPILLGFSYAHGIINLYALVTTYKVVWGSQATAHANTTMEAITMALTDPASCDMSEFRVYSGPVSATIDANPTTEQASGGAATALDLETNDDNLTSRN